MQGKDITGQKFGYWTVLGRDYDYHSPKHAKWICRCECGTVKSVFKTTLLSGRSKSCGCHSADNLKGINATHGLSDTRIYHTWSSMKRRCSPKSHNDRKIYYDRGIKVCDEWASDFMAFYEWAMSNGYNDTLSIDRIDNDGDYSPSNCRWVAIEKQQSNKRNNINVEYNGKVYDLHALCRLLDFPYKTAHRRFQRMKKRGDDITPEKLFEPLHTEKIAVRYR